MQSGKCHPIPLVMDALGTLLSTQEARVALSYRLRPLLRLFRAKEPPAYIHNSIVFSMALTIC